MVNRSHRNSGLKTMNRLRRDGQPHVSERSPPAAPTRSQHHVWTTDVLEGLRRLPAGVVRLAICDPPYNLAMANWDTHADYRAWAARWLDDIVRALRPDGSLVLFGGLQFQGESGGDLLELMHYLRQQSALRLINLIVWNYPNGMSAQRFFANRHEQIVWYARGPGYVFNLDEVREPYDEATRAAYARDPRLRPESIAKGRNPTNVWRMGRLGARAAERTGHPTQKPRVLIERLVRALSHPGDWVLDPFAGSGVTTRVAIAERRHSIGIDSDPNWRQHLHRQLSDLSADSEPWDLLFDSPFEAEPIAM